MCTRCILHVCLLTTGKSSSKSGAWCKETDHPWVTVHFALGKCRGPTAQFLKNRDLHRNSGLN